MIYEAEPKIVCFHHGGTEVTEKDFLSVGEVPTDKKTFQPHQGTLLANGLEFMENRHLPILHKKLSSVSSVSRASQPWRNERVVNIFWNVDYLVLSVI